MRTFCHSFFSLNSSKIIFKIKLKLIIKKGLIVTDQRALMLLYSFKETDELLARWIEKLGQFDFEIKHEAGKKIPHADCLSKFPQTGCQVKDCDQVNQVKTEDKNIWSIGLRKSVEQLVEYQKNSADIFILRNWIENGKSPQRKKEPLGHRGRSL